jgi:hypothetical protein
LAKVPERVFVKSGTQFTLARLVVASLPEDGSLLDGIQHLVGDFKKASKRSGVIFLEEFTLFFRMGIWIFEARVSRSNAGHGEYFALPLRNELCFNNQTMSFLNLTSTQLRQAADLKERIAGLEQQLADLTSSDPGSGIPAPLKTKRGRPAKVKPAPEAEAAKVPGKRGPKKGGMSAAGRAAIIAAQKARWAKVKATKTEAPKAAAEAKPKTGKRTMSAAAKLAISKAAKARWAKVRAAK